MTPIARARFLLLFLLFISGHVAADDDARAWLMKIHQASMQRDYEGVFVYQHGSQLEAMRIVHKIEKGMVRERLVSLNGSPREIIRNEREVLCYLPDENAVVVEHRRADDKGFPAIMPERLAEIDGYYSMQLGRTERIAGRPAQPLHIQPRDQYRYGYRLWADHDTGLLLKADLLDGKGKVLEQFMFTQMQVGTVPATSLQPENPGKGMVWHREGEFTPADPGRPWTATAMPKGFKLARQVWRTVPKRQKKVEHLVYSDGLATVSVFVEQLDAGAKPGMEGPSHMGAVHAYVVRTDGHRVTTVGEVPAETVSMIAKSVKPKR